MILSLCPTKVICSTTPFLSQMGEEGGWGEGEVVRCAVWSGGEEHGQATA